MACFSPRKAIRTSMFTRKGKHVIKFISDEIAQSIGSSPNLLEGLPCGQCVGCRLDRSRQWAIRMTNEAQLYDENCFITLTFDDEHLLKRANPKSLDKSEVPDFFKRLRRRVSDPEDVMFRDSYSELIPLDFRDVIRYYMCGEYGEIFRRPHYHAIVFNYDFSDKVLEKIVDGRRYYSSKLLSELWPFGFCLITDCTFDTCAYVARYIMKKVTGKDAWKSYFEYMDEETGELVGHRIPEYTTMSRRSGIGKEWLDKYLADVYPKDKIFMRGRGYSKPPKYYDSQFEIVDPEEFASLKSRRVEAAKLRSDDNTPERLKVKQAVKLAQISLLKRELE